MTLKIIIVLILVRQVFSSGQFYQRHARRQTFVSICMAIAIACFGIIGDIAAYVVFWTALLLIKINNVRKNFRR